ncbi:metallophosphoesterase [Synechococcus sp. 8F6]|uniref:metallophosphoesterase family protein n=1 Tax=Synechococcus sp. 8F6 TaxID=2025606 RepID=UPI001E59A5C2|nr:metallophosphoesterase [Synechococcus sp. 8F6]
MDERPMHQWPGSSLRRRDVLGLAGLALGAWATTSLPSRPAAASSNRVGASALPPRGDLRLVAISDLNSSYGSTSYLPEVLRAVELIPSWKPDLVLCGGDMVAGQKQGLSRVHLSAMWASFHRQLLAPLRRAGLPVAITMGNHDASSARSGGRYAFELDRQEAERYWRGQEDGLGLSFVDASRFPFAYSVRQHNLFLLVWDASSATVPAEQVAWAERQLSSPAAQSARLRLVLGHLPFYAVGQGRDTPGNVLQQSDALRQLLERTGAHAYISGHHHAYFPGRVGQLDLLNLGALGSGPRRRLQDPSPPVQTLTLIDAFWPRGEGTGEGSTTGRTVYTTYNMRTLQPIASQQLPAQIRPSQGPVLRRIG